MTTFTVIYVESHPDREIQFLGVWTSPEAADLAIQEHMSREKRALPQADISKYNYTTYVGEINEPGHSHE
jgi:hypothetical protein